MLPSSNCLREGSGGGRCFAKHTLGSKCLSLVEGINGYTSKLCVIESSKNMSGFGGEGGGDWGLRPPSPFRIFHISFVANRLSSSGVVQSPQGPLFLSFLDTSLKKMLLKEWVTIDKVSHAEGVEILL